jgi:prepilin-type N-terminal cleavage/methylation domain-containing protein
MDLARSMNRIGRGRGTVKHRSRHYRTVRRRGFTLMESLMASGILLVIVIAVTSSITAAQQHALEAHERIAGVLAAEELMGRILSGDYDSLAAWDGFREPVGAMVDMNNNPLPASTAMIGREVDVYTSVRTTGDLEINIRGRTVRVQAFNSDDRMLCDLIRFVPEDQE